MTTHEIITQLKTHLTGRILNDIITTWNSYNPAALAACCGRHVVGVRLLQPHIQLLFEPPHCPDEPHALLLPADLIHLRATRFHIILQRRNEHTIRLHISRLAGRRRYPNTRCAGHHSQPDTGEKP